MVRVNQGEVPVEDTRVCYSCTTLGGGFVEDDDFGLEGGDCQSVSVIGGEGHVVRVREGQVRVVTLYRVNEVDDVETPKEGRE